MGWRIQVTEWPVWLEGFWTHLLPEGGDKGHMWALALISQDPNLEAGKKGARISIQALSLSWFHDHMTKVIASQAKHTQHLSLIHI